MRPKRGAKTPNKMNRSQQRAMSVRAAETVIPPSPQRDAAGVQARSAPAAAVPVGRRRAMARPTVLTREVEYAFIRADLRRMLITAGSLLAVMLILLFFVES
jgi:hypothetical protein